MERRGTAGQSLIRSTAVCLLIRGAAATERAVRAAKATRASRAVLPTPKLLHVQLNPNAAPLGLSRQAPFLRLAPLPDQTNGSTATTMLSRPTHHPILMSPLNLLIPSAQKMLPRKAKFSNLRATRQGASGGTTSRQLLLYLLQSRALSLLGPSPKALFLLSPSTTTIAIPPRACPRRGPISTVVPHLQWRRVLAVLPTPC